MKIPLQQGAYEARSPIANSQVCINLYPETNPHDAPFPVTHYPAPGLALLVDYSSYGSQVRGLYQTSNGYIVAVVGVAVLASTYDNPGAVLVGNLVSNSGMPVSMCDNGVTLVIVDSSINGYMAPLATLGTPGGLVQIDDPAFYGSSRVDYIDTFMIFNQIGTGNFYTTTSGVVTPFDPTYVAAKEGWNDRLICAACLHDNIWLFGNQTTEIWYNAGGTTFPFARMPNSILQQGCTSPWSVIIVDNAVYWLSQDRWGHAMMMRGEGYMAKRVSTFAVEDAWSKMPTVGDCIGMAYQIGGHEIVGFYFPSGGAWWAFDASTQMWHQRTYGDLSTPWLPYCTAYQGTAPFVTPPVNRMLAGDRSSGRIYFIDRNTYTDDGVAIQRQRSWAHNQQDGNRIHHARFSANMAGAPLSPDTVALDWSDDAGQSYGSPVPQTINNQTNGQYQWRRLGYARDRVYRLTWSGAGECALNGAYIDVIPQGT